jgi:hypothetical protein
MKKIAICGPEFPDQTAGVNAPPQFGICIVDQSSPPTPAPPERERAGATACQAEGDDMLPLAHPVSVVSKVAKLLTGRSPNSVWDHPLRQKDGCSYQKVMLSLQTKQSL